MNKLIQFVDSKVLSILTILFIILIPLYPKFPFIQIHDTYISIRLEDFFVAIMAVVLIIQTFRKKVYYDWNFIKLFIAFWTVVIISFLVNYFITKNIDFRNIGILHTLRRIEYMVPFFVAYSALKSEILKHPNVINKIVNKYFSVAIWTVLLVCLYALGQRSATIFQPLRDNLQWISDNNVGILHTIFYFLFRFFDFPAVQTMNAEFAKGHLLNLTPFSRISSTFAGHYDLAAFLVFFIPIIAGLIMQGKNLFRNIITYMLSILTLVLTASRISFGAFIASIVLFLVYQRKWKGLILTILLTVVLMLINKDMTERFQDMFQKKRVFENVQTGAVIIDQDLSTSALPAGNQFVSQTVSVPVMSTKDKQDLTNQLIKKELEEAKKSGKSMSNDEAMRIVEGKYKELQNFVAKDVIAGDTSLTTRTQIEWPRAINAFLKNPIIGTGPSSITESTDGDYFRWLGETGFAGAGLFMFILGYIWIKSFAISRKIKTNEKYIFVAYCASLIALFVNATLIDVFEASKVAFIFWVIAGIMMAYVDSKSNQAVEAK